MRINFVDHNQIQHVVNGFNELFQFMIKTGNIDADHIKDFLEKYFQQAGYREGKKKSAVENILIIHDSGIGDFIIMSAAIREIRRIYPKAHITLVIKNNVNDLAEFCPHVDEAIVFNQNCDRYDDFFKFYETAILFSAYLLRRRIDVAFNFGQRAGSTLLAYMSGAKVITDHYSIGNFNDFKAGKIPLDFFSSLANFKINRQVNKHFNKPHFNEKFLYILNDFSKADIKNKSLEVWLSPRDKFLAEKTLQSVANKKLFALTMGSNINLKCKRWSPHLYSKLINKIIDDDPNCAFIILGGKSELDESKIVCDNVDNNYIINLTGKINYRQSCAILNYCDYYIGNDTGLMHSAAALKIPVLTPNCYPADIPMSISSFPQKYYPYGVPSVH